MRRATDREALARFGRERVRGEVALAEMDAVRLGQKCEVESVIHDEACTRCPRQGSDLTRKGEDFLVGGMFRSQLDDAGAAFAGGACLLYGVTPPARIVIGKHV